ncbi:MAG: DUF4412 domain-containing protein [Nitrospirae bacterium]|nr:DUF4412 domain-containing protein [Nitrospirota bacterium]
MKKLSVFLVILSLLIFINTKSWALSFVLSTVDYSADQTMETGNMKMNSKVYYTPNKMRMEQEFSGMQQIMINRFDKHLVWTLMPQMKSYNETQIKPQDLPTEHNPNVKVEQTVVGKETINGLETTKTKITVTNNDGSKFEGFFWGTKDKIQVKMEGSALDKNGKTVNMKITLTNIKIAPQDPKLFEIPEGYVNASSGGGNGSNINVQEMLKNMKKR